MLTAKEFGQRPDPGHPEELVQGRVVRRPPPDRKHGFVCSKVVRILGNFVEGNDLGRVLSNDSGVITQTTPDTIRGADIAYYSYARPARGSLPAGYGPEVAELVVEVASASDRWPKVYEKVEEYLKAGVLAVVVLDPRSESAQLYRTDEVPKTLRAEDVLRLPGLLEAFQVRVGQFFE